MKLNRLLILIFALVIFFVPSFAIDYCNTEDKLNSEIHCVVKGEWLSKIYENADKTEFPTIDDFADNSNINNKNLILINQKIYLTKRGLFAGLNPFGGSDPGFYTVVSGDSLTKIFNREVYPQYGNSITLGEFIQANMATGNIKSGNPNLIQLGEQIIVFFSDVSSETIREEEDTVEIIGDLTKFDSDRLSVSGIFNSYSQFIKEDLDGDYTFIVDLNYVLNDDQTDVEYAEQIYTDNNLAVHQDFIIYVIYENGDTTGVIFYRNENSVFTDGLIQSIHESVDKGSSILDDDEKARLKVLFNEQKAAEIARKAKEVEDSRNLIIDQINIYLETYELILAESDFSDVEDKFDSICDADYTYLLSEIDTFKKTLDGMEVRADQELLDSLKQQIDVLSENHRLVMQCRMDNIGIDLHTDTRLYLAFSDIIEKYYNRNLPYQSNSICAISLRNIDSIFNNEFKNVTDGNPGVSLREGSNYDEVLTSLQSEVDRFNENGCDLNYQNEVQELVNSVKENKELLFKRVQEVSGNSEYQLACNNLENEINPLLIDNKAENIIRIYDGQIIQDYSSYDDLRDFEVELTEFYNCWNLDLDQIRSKFDTDETS